MHKSEPAAHTHRQHIPLSVSHSRMHLRHPLPCRALRCVCVPSMGRHTIYDRTAADESTTSDALFCSRLEMLNRRTMPLRFSEHAKWMVCTMYFAIRQRRLNRRWSLAVKSCSTRHTLCDDCSSLNEATSLIITAHFDDNDDADAPRHPHFLLLRMSSPAHHRRIIFAYDFIKSPLGRISNSRRASETHTRV